TALAVNHVRGIVLATDWTDALGYAGRRAGRSGTWRRHRRGNTRAQHRAMLRDDSPELLEPLVRRGPLCRVEIAFLKDELQQASGRDRAPGIGTLVVAKGHL